MLDKETENKLAVAFLKTTSLEEDFKAVATTEPDLERACISAGFMSGDSGFYTPQPIKLKGTKRMFTLFQNGVINVESEIVSLGDGSYQVYRMTMKAYYRWERFVRENQ